MYCIIKNNKVIGTCDFEPCTNDLASRNEISIQSDIAQIGWSYDNGIFTPPEPVIIDHLISIRIQRDFLLSKSDKYMITDYPITETKRQEWITYRQQLRDLPETCDINNPIFPTPPQQ